MQNSLFDSILWKDPLSDRKLEPIVSACWPSGVPIYGALKISGTNRGYPIVDSVARLTPELAKQYAKWLQPFNLLPPEDDNDVQNVETVESFGFQWCFNTNMRSDQDLKWRCADRFKVTTQFFANKLLLDAGSGAGDQSSWLLEQGASVISLDLSQAIDVVSLKNRLNPNWFGIQGDLTRLPLASNSIDCVYCEGVIQHTRDSMRSVKELVRVSQINGSILATHYSSPRTTLGKIRRYWHEFVRSRVSSLPKFQRLLVAGNLATLAYIPLVRKLALLSGTATFQPSMPDFKTTWTNTHDSFGGHAYQRYIAAADFYDLFLKCESVKFELKDGMVVHCKKFL